MLGVNPVGYRVRLVRLVYRGAPLSVRARARVASGDLVRPGALGAPRRAGAGSGVVPARGRLSVRLRDTGATGCLGCPRGCESREPPLSACPAAGAPGYARTPLEGALRGCAGVRGAVGAPLARGHLAGRVGLTRGLWPGRFAGYP